MQPARRKLIKGALAATAVTAAGCGGGSSGGGGGGGGMGGGLGSGPSAFSVPTQGRAVMSWHLCMERSAQEAEAAQVQPLTEVDDTYLRMELPVADGLVVDGKTIEGQYFLDGTRRWREIAAGGSSSTVTQWSELTAQPRALRTRYAMVAIDDFGYPIQTRLEGPEGNVATDSCWHSVITRAGTKIG